VAKLKKYDKSKEKFDSAKDPTTVTRKKWKRKMRRKRKRREKRKMN
jgi:hypothetical protein